jgi:hypothetical protein
MKKSTTFKLRTLSPIFLILGLIFFVIGLYSNNDLFTWIAIGLIVISLLVGGKWLRRK